MKTSAVLLCLCAIVAFGDCRALFQVSASTAGKATNGVSTNGDGDMVSKLIAAGSSSSTNAEKSDQVHKQLSQSMSVVGENVQDGVVAMMKPAIDFMMHTAPNMAHLYSIIQTGKPMRRDVAEFAKDLWGQGAVKLSEFMGQGMVTGSNLAKGAMQWGGKALTGVNGLVNGGTEAAIDLSYKIANITMEIEIKKIEMMTKALEEFGKVLDNAGSNMESYAAEIQTVLRGVDGKVNLTIENLKKVLAKVLSDGVQTLADGSRKFRSDALKLFVEMCDKYDLKLEELHSKVLAISGKTSDIESSTSNAYLNGQLNAGINSGASSSSYINDYLSSASDLNTNVNTDESSDWTNNGNLYSTGEINMAV